ncbi:UbiA prenyltransferase family-domain-containing protein [Phellopilus nigrolimitatus]|nr:UbiA prenyltransferase family-domain-containing protein [Phellopilus nigrolimitatus]
MPSFPNTFETEAQSPPPSGVTRLNDNLADKSVLSVTIPRTVFDSLLRLPSKALYHFNTTLLFTASDWKTTVIPIVSISISFIFLTPSFALELGARSKFDFATRTSLACASAPLSSPTRIPHVLFWTWFHVLQFNFSNQTVSPEEDALNKPERPIPAKRIALETALFFRWWVMPPLCCLLSVMYSWECVGASMLLCVFTVLYDELGASAGHWAGRNAVNALGFMAFELGSCLIAGPDLHTLDTTALLAIACSMGIFATTIQAQDFEDEPGDRAVGRQTLPIVAPSLARPTLLLAILAWSIGLSFLWELSLAYSAAFVALGTIVGLRFVLWGGVEVDHRSFILYNVWLSIAHALPAYYRFVVVQTA